MCIASSFVSNHIQTDDKTCKSLFIFSRTVSHVRGIFQREAKCTIEHLGKKSFKLFVCVECTAFFEFKESQLTNARDGKRVLERDSERWGKRGGVERVWKSGKETGKERQAISVMVRILEGLGR